MTTLPFDFDIFLRSGSRTHPEIAVCFHGKRAVFERGAQHGIEEPRPNDFVALRTQIHRKHAREQIGIAKPVARNLRRQRRRRPRVHDVGIAGEAIRLIPLSGRVTLGRVGRWVDRQLRFLRHDRSRVIHLSVSADRIPHRETARRRIAAG